MVPCKSLSTHEYTFFVIGLVSYTGWIKRFRVPLLLRLWRENRGKIDGSNSTAQTTRVVVPNSERFFRTFVISRTIDDNLNYFFLHSINSRGKMIMNHIDLWSSCLFFLKVRVFQIRAWVPNSEHFLKITASICNLWATTDFILKDYTWT